MVLDIKLCLHEEDISTHLQAFKNNSRISYNWDLRALLVYKCACAQKSLVVLKSGNVDVHFSS